MPDNFKQLHQFGLDLLKNASSENDPALKQAMIDAAGMYFKCTGDSVIEEVRFSSVKQVILMKGDSITDMSESKYSISGNQGQIASIGDKNTIEDNTFNQLNTVPAEFEDAIKSLRELITNSSLSDLDKEEATTEVDRINQLAGKDKTPELVEKAQKRIDLLKTTLETGKLLLKAGSYIAVLSQFFV